MNINQELVVFMLYYWNNIDFNIFLNIILNTFTMKTAILQLHSKQ